MVDNSGTSLFSEMRDLFIEVTQKDPAKGQAGLKLDDPLFFKNKKALSWKSFGQGLMSMCDIKGHLEETNKLALKFSEKWL